LILSGTSEGRALETNFDKSRHDGKAGCGMGADARMPIVPGRKYRNAATPTVSLGAPVNWAENLYLGLQRQAPCTAPPASQLAMIRVAALGE
jgi:hypothetical protein